ncbi:MAG: tyrosine-type recombinase/integrase, partial [Oscillospiraceae bacterium]|nr:tyrosine-type recombinase/integrase [Oscillospiraceae bacterium]
MDEDGKKRRLTKTQAFDKKSDAIAALPALAKQVNKKPKQTTTFLQLYDKWLPTHQASKSTLDCYKAAMKYFRPLWNARMENIDIDDIQECFDDCPKGKRTQENMKALVGLVYKYGIPRGCIPENLNLSQFVRIGSSESAAHRESFTDVEIAKIKKAVGTVPYADVIYCMIYLGFRPSEFLSLQKSNYNSETQTIRAGAKTEAGKNRLVTISPKIQATFSGIVSSSPSEFIFCRPDGNPWDLKRFCSVAFYPALDAIGIENPIVEIAGGVERHKYTPHTCRHTFSTLLKRVEAPVKDKLELIGHTSEEMLNYYQDVTVQDLRKVTDFM